MTSLYIPVKLIKFTSMTKTFFPKYYYSRDTWVSYLLLNNMPWIWYIESLLYIFLYILILYIGLLGLIVSKKCFETFQ